jgi:hypothetical protein
MKHTPGPWKLGIPFNGYVWGPKESRTLYLNGNAEIPVASIELLRQPTGEDLANARLISRAPTMLNLMEEALANLACRLVHPQSCYDPDDPTGGSPDGDCIMCRMKREIEIARGERDA